MSRSGELRRPHARDGVFKGTTSFPLVWPHFFRPTWSSIMMPASLLRRIPAPCVRRSRLSRSRIPVAKAGNARQALRHEPRRLLHLRVGDELRVRQTVHGRHAIRS